MALKDVFCPHCGRQAQPEGPCPDPTICCDAQRAINIGRTPTNWCYGIEECLVSGLAETPEEEAEELAVLAKTKNEGRLFFCSHCGKDYRSKAYVDELFGI